MPPSDSPILDDIKSAASDLIDPVLGALGGNPWPRRLINACNAAYMISDRRLGSGLPLLEAAGMQKGTRPLVFVSGIHDVHAGFVCRTDDDGLLVTFRGTLPPEDMIFGQRHPHYRPFQGRGDGLSRRDHDPGTISRPPHRGVQFRRADDRRPGFHRLL